METRIVWIFKSDDHNNRCGVERELGLFTDNGLSAECIMTDTNTSMRLLFNFFFPLS